MIFPEEIVPWSEVHRLAESDGGLAGRRRCASGGSAGELAEDGRPVSVKELLDAPGPSRDELTEQGE